MMRLDEPSRASTLRQACAELVELLRTGKGFAQQALRRTWHVRIIACFVRPEPACPEPVEGSKGKSTRSDAFVRRPPGESRLRAAGFAQQASRSTWHERTLACFVRPEPAKSVRPELFDSVRPELVEGSKGKSTRSDTFVRRPPGEWAGEKRRLPCPGQLVKGRLPCAGPLILALLRSA